MEGSGDRGVTATLSAVLSSPSPGFYPLTDWNVRPGLLLLSTDCLIVFGDTITGMVKGLQHAQAFIENSEFIWYF